MAEKKHFELEDFIGTEVESDDDNSSKISPKSRLIDFANVQIGSVDPRIRKEIEETAQRIKTNLQQLKNLVRE